MSDLQNEFSWSVSQGKAFDDCKRAYYYSRYGSWEGWPSGKGDPRAKELYMLKNLTAKEMWVGSAVHSIIKYLLEGLRNGYSYGYDDIERRLVARMRDDISSSRQGLYKKDPKYKVGFAEDEYGLPMSDGELDDTIEFAIKCLQNFFNSAAFARLKKTRKDQWLTIDEARPGSFIFEGAKVFVKIDAAVLDAGRIFIYDWKTSRKEDVDYSLQLACYLAYASRRWNVDPSQVMLCEVNVATNRSEEHEGSKAKIDWFEGYARNSMLAMKAHLLDKENNIAAEEDFERVNSLRYCRRCSYRRICRPPVLEVAKKED